MNKINFTFIIPVYNAEKTLKEAIDSIPRSKNYCIEILVVINESTDKTVLIANELMNTYLDIKILNSSKGVSKARNVGLDEAKGDWIIFLDADDEMNTESLSKIMNQLIFDTENDIHFFNFQKNRKLIHALENYKELVDKSSIESFISHTLSHPTLFLTVWGKAIRRKLIHDTRFNENLYVSEDSNFIIRLLFKANKIVLNRDFIYKYSVTSTSTMNTYDNFKTKGYIKSLVELSPLFLNKSLPLQLAFEQYKTVQFNLSMVRQVFQKGSPLSYHYKITEMKKIASLPIYQNAISSMKIKNIKSIGDIPIWLINRKYYFIAAFVYSIRVFENNRKGMDK